MTAMTLSSCSDNFLEEKKNYDNVTPTEVYADYTGASARVNDIYAWCLPDANAEANWKYNCTGVKDEQSKSTEEFSGFTVFTNPQQEMSVANGNVPGVSAGALFGCNFKSRQRGRALRYNIQLKKDPRYMGLRSLFKTGDIVGAEFSYHVVPFDIDPFDGETFRRNPMDFWLVATDIETGKPVYHRMDEFNLLDAVERLTPEVFEKVKGHRRDLCANVDLYSGFVYDMLNIPTDLYTPLFAVGRVVGWCAHRMEELINSGPIIRPAYKSVRKHHEYIPIEKR